jgi:hypothetical protein
MCARVCVSVCVCIVAHSFEAGITLYFRVGGVLGDEKWRSWELGVGEFDLAYPNSSLLFCNCSGSSQARSALSRVASCTGDSVCSWNRWRITFTVGTSSPGHRAQGCVYTLKNMSGNLLLKLDWIIMNTTPGQTPSNRNGMCGYQENEHEANEGDTKEQEALTLNERCRKEKHDVTNTARRSPTLNVTSNVKKAHPGPVRDIPPLTFKMPNPFAIRTPRTLPSTNSAPPSLRPEPLPP